MADKTRVYTSCEHVADVSNYCEACNIFVCDDCSKDHLEHIESVCAWDSEVKEYLQLWKNCQSRCRVLIKTKVNEEQLRIDTFKKIDTAFDAAVKKLEEARQKTKDDVWAKRTHEKLKDEPAPLMKLDDVINGHAGVIEKFLDKEDKEGLLKQLSAKSELPAVELTLDGFKKEKTAALLHAKEIKDFKCDETFDYDKIMNNISYGAPFIPGMADNVFFASNCHSTKCETCPKTVCSNYPLPAYFKVTIKKPKGVAAMVGLSKKYFEGRSEEIGKLEGEFAIGPDGAIVKGGSGTPGNPATKDEEIISIYYEKTKKLAFEYAGKKQAKQFEKIDGPWFLAVTLPDKSDCMSIVDIKKL